MNLVVDIGNTNIFMGVFQDSKLVNTFRTSSDVTKSRDEYEMILNSFLTKHKLKSDEIDHILLSSVVPMLNNTFKDALRSVFSLEPLLLVQGVKTGLAIRIDNPGETGSDLIADCVGGIARYGSKLLIVDLGTASKILVVDEHSSFVGGVIMPGLKISMEALAKKTANLKEIDLSSSKTIIGKNTIDCINSGLINGNKMMIKGLCEEMEKELGYKCKRILTGGYASLLEGMKDFIKDDTLILDGLNIILNKNIELEEKKSHE